MVIFIKIVPKIGIFLHFGYLMVKDDMKCVSELSNLFQFFEKTGKKSAPVTRRNCIK